MRGEIKMTTNNSDVIVRDYTSNFSVKDLIKNNLIPRGVNVISKGQPLFVRLDKAEEIEYIKQAMKV